MTPAQQRQLETLAAASPEGLRPAQFARLYFPVDHVGWQRVYRCGPRGSTRGAGLWRSAAGLLGKLHRAGLAEYVFGRGSSPGKYRISPAGLAALRTIQTDPHR